MTTKQVVDLEASSTGVPSSATEGVSPGLADLLEKTPDDTSEESLPAGPGEVMPPGEPSEEETRQAIEENIDAYVGLFIDTIEDISIKAFCAAGGKPVEAQEVMSFTSKERAKLEKGLIPVARKRIPQWLKESPYKEEIAAGIALIAVMAPRFAAIRMASGGETHS